MDRKWYQEPWAIIALLVFFFPVGLYLMWRHATWQRGIKWAVTGILAVLVIVAAVSGAVGGDDDGDDSGLVVGGTPTELTQTEQPTEVPTELPTQLATEAPTKEPTEAPTQGPPAFTAAECAYLSTLQEQSGVFGEALTELGGLLSEPRFLSDQWIFGVAAQLVIIQFTHDEASALSPPASLQQIHEAYMQGLSKLNEATFLIPEGIDNLDPIPLLEATDLMLEGNEDINRTTALIGDFGAARSGSC